MSKEVKEIVTPNLAQLGLDIQALVQQDYVLLDGYPRQQGFLYVAHLIAVEKRGRPVGSTKEVLKEAYANAK